MNLILQIALIPFKVIHQGPGKVSLYVRTIKYRSWNIIYPLDIVEMVTHLYTEMKPTFEKLVDIMFVEIFSVHIVQVANSVGVAIFCYVNWNISPVFICDPVHHFSNSKRSHIEPRRCGSEKRCLIYPN